MDRKGVVDEGDRGEDVMASCIPLANIAKNMVIDLIIVGKKFGKPDQVAHSTTTEADPTTLSPNMIISRSEYDRLMKSQATVGSTPSSHLASASNPSTALLASSPTSWIID